MWSASAPLWCHPSCYIEARGGWSLAWYRPRCDELHATKPWDRHSASIASKAAQLVLLLSRVSLFSSVSPTGRHQDTRRRVPAFDSRQSLSSIAMVVLCYSLSCCVLGRRTVIIIDHRIGEQLEDAVATYKTTRSDAPTDEELYFALQGSGAAWYVRESRQDTC